MTQACSPLGCTLFFCDKVVFVQTRPLYSLHETMPGCYSVNVGIGSCHDIIVSSIKGVGHGGPACMGVLSVLDSTGCILQQWECVV